MSKKPVARAPKAPKPSKARKPYRKIAPLKPTPAKRGRPSIYSEALVDELLRRLQSGPMGRALYDVCNDADMPEEWTVYRWDDPNGSHPEFCGKLARARDLRFQKAGERMVTLGVLVTADNEQGKKLDPARVRAAVDAFDKAARLMSDKIKRVQLTGAGGGPVQYQSGPDFTGWSAQRIERYQAGLKQLAEIAAAED